MRYAAPVHQQGKEPCIGPQDAELKVFEVLQHCLFVQYSCATFEKRWKRKLGSVLLQC